MPITKTENKSKNISDPNVKGSSKGMKKANVKNKDTDNNDLKKDAKNKDSKKVNAKDKEEVKANTKKAAINKNDSKEENIKNSKNEKPKADSKEEISKDTKKVGKEANAKNTKVIQIAKPKKLLFSKKPELKELTFVDLPDKPQKPNKYVHQIVQLDRLNNQFDTEKFQALRHTSMSNSVIDSLRRIGMCLNKIDPSQLPKKNVSKVLFILITANNDSGCFNDAYLMALIHKKLNFKIVFLYNTDHKHFLEMLEYFLVHTINSLTFYYSGNDSASKIRNIGHGIKFIDKSFVSSQDLGQFIAEKSNGKTYILVLSDCASGGSIFDMKSAKEDKNKSVSDIISFTSHKSELTSDEKINSHGLFTYYYAKILRQFPALSPKDMAASLNQSLQRFKISYTYNTSDLGDRLSDDIIYEDADTAFNGPNAEITGPSKRKKVEAPKKKTVEAIPIEFQNY